MGIRIHKALGYGLTDLVAEDPRIDPEFERRFNEEEEFSLEGFEEYMKAALENGNIERHEAFKLEISLALQILGEKKYSHFYRCVKHDVEFGLPNIWMVTPPSHCCSWHRCDDIIDYTEETSGNKTEPRYAVVKTGISPYANLYMDNQTGVKVTGATGWLPVDMLFTYFGNLTKSNYELLSRVAVVLGFKSADLLRKRLTPYVPQEVRLFCEYLSVFKDPKTVLSLKPLLYVYWA